MFSELFPMENSVTFPSDPNPTQTGVRSGTRRNAQSRRLPEQFQQAACAFLFFFSSDVCHEAADFLRGFFFHARRDVRVDIQRKFRRGMTENFRDRFRVDTALDCQRRECVSEVMESDVFLNTSLF